MFLLAVSVAIFISVNQEISAQNVRPYREHFTIHNKGSDPIVIGNAGLVGGHWDQDKSPTGERILVNSQLNVTAYSDAVNAMQGYIEVKKADSPLVSANVTFTIDADGFHAYKSTEIHHETLCTVRRFDPSGVKILCR